MGEKIRDKLVNNVTHVHVPNYKISFVFFMKDDAHHKWVDFMAGQENK